VALEILGSFYKYQVDFDEEDISASMGMRLELKKKGLDISYAVSLLK